MKKTHTHHIIPKHMGGIDEPDNLIELSVKEHAEAHKLLWEAHGRKEDRLAWLSLSKQISIPDFKKELAAIAGKANKGKIAWFNIETNICVRQTTKPKGEGWIKGRGATFESRIVDFRCDNRGYIWCHDKDDIGNTKMVKDEKNIPDGWVKGRHESNVISTLGFRWYHNPMTGERKTSPVVLEGDWIAGLPLDLVEKRKFTKGNDYSRNRSGSKWFHNPDNPIQTKMIKDDEIVPLGWIRGRSPRK